jgi:hypothetical protein
MSVAIEGANNQAHGERLDLLLQPFSSQLVGMYGGTLG